MVEVTKIWWDGERLMAEPIDSAIMYKDNEVAQPDSTCNKTLRAEGKGYPRTCRKCDKGSCIADRVQPDAYGYAKRLALAIWEQHYKDVAPQWKPLDDLIGVLTQIDNMTAGLTTQRQPLTNEAIWRQYQALWPFHPAEEPRLAADLIEFARAIEAAHNIKDNT